MKRCINVFAVAIIAMALCLSGASPANAEAKIAVVNVQRLLSESKAAVSIQKNFETHRVKFQQELETHGKEATAMQQEIAKQADSASPEAIQKKAELDKKLIDINQLRQKRSGALNKATQTAAKELQKNITEVVAEIAQKEKYDLILNRQSVILAAETLDITSQVLKALDDKVTKIDLKVETN